MKGLAPTPPPLGHALEPLENSLGLWNYCASLAETWWSRHGGVPLQRLARQRLRALLHHARADSPFHRGRLAHLPPDIDSLENVPVLTRAELMAHFDAACTDPAVHRAEVERFVADPRRVGEPFRHRYHVWKSSGTCGTPGLFVQDEQAMAVYAALVAMQLDASRMNAARFIGAQGRAALVAATGDHFAAITSWEHLRRSWPGIAVRSFSILAPLPELVAQLNDWQPAMLASYPSLLALLAAQARAGRLRIAPALLWSGGETLTDAARAAIERAFGCAVVNEYGASECLSIASGCRAGWLHVNTEWAIVEPVDANGRPTPAGKTSHTVLVTNLANHVQPIIRYDLGDRTRVRKGACPCGNLSPAIRVDGRCDAVLALRAEGGARVHLAPLAVTTVIEAAIGERRFQLVQEGPARLVLRLEGTARERTAAFAAAAAALEAWLARQHLAHVAVALGARGPCADPRSGKLHAVIARPPWRARPAPR